MFWVSFIGGILIILIAIGIGFIIGYAKAYNELAPEDDLENVIESWRNDSAQDNG